MFPIGAEITIEGPLAALLKKSALNQILKAVHHDMATWYAAKKLKKHFTPAGAVEYGYKRRSEQYRRRKRRKRGHQNPLVWSGELKSKILSAAGVRVSATSRTATLELRPTRTIHFRGRTGSGPDMAKELTMVSARELRACARFVEQRFADKVRRYSGMVKISSGPSRGRGGRFRRAA